MIYPAQAATDEVLPLPIWTMLFSFIKIPSCCLAPGLRSSLSRDWTVVTVVTMVPSGMMVRSTSTFLVGVIEERIGKELWVLQGSSASKYSNWRRRRKREQMEFSAVQNIQRKMLEEGDIWIYINHLSLSLSRRCTNAMLAKNNDLRTHLSCDGSIRCQAMSWAYWQFLLSNFTPGLQGYGGVARQEFYPGSKQKWKSSCVYIDRIKSVLSVARKPHNGACCNKPHPKNANKKQPVCQQCNLGSDDLNETT